MAEMLFYWRLEEIITYEWLNQCIDYPNHKLLLFHFDSGSRKATQWLFSLNTQIR